MKKIIYLSCLMALALTACSKSGSFESEESSDLLKTEIGVRPMGGTLTRSAISGTAFPQGYDMMVSTFHNAATSADYFENVAFGYDATSDAWKSKSGVKYFPLEGTLDFLAVASAGYNTASSGIVPTAVWGESENAAKKVVLTVPDNSGKFDDLLYGALNAQGPTSAGLPMVFRHAMTSVVFVAKCNTEYNAESNAGITINSITLDGAKYSGTLTVSNPGAGGGSGVVSAEWSALGDAKAHQGVRVWDSANSGVNASEPELVDLPLGKTAATLSEKPFGEGYVILPAQASVQITVNYTVHNGFNAGGAAVNTANTYSFTPTVATWSMGKKYVYELDFQLSEILINPTVVDWDEQAAEEQVIS